MENLNIEKRKITWEDTKIKHGSEIKYKNEILKHEDHISVSKTMYVNGEFKRQDLTHVPIELIDRIKSFCDESDLPCENQWCEDGWVMEIYGEKIPCGICERK